MISFFAFALIALLSLIIVRPDFWWRFVLIAAPFAYWFWRRWRHGPSADAPRGKSDYVDLPLLLFVLIGTVLLVAFGFDLVPWAGVSQEPWVGWLRGAILWTLFLAAYYGRFVREIESDGYANTFLVVLVFVMGGLCVWFILDSFWGPGIPEDRAVAHLWLAIAIGLCMCALDWILMWHHSDPDDGRAAAAKALVYADVPALISFVVLRCYVAVVPFNSHILVSGGLAFQLVSSHIIFTAVEAEARRKEAKPIAVDEEAGTVVADEDPTRAAGSETTEEEGLIAVAETRDKKPMPPPPAVLWIFLLRPPIEPEAPPKAKAQPASGD